MINIKDIDNAFKFYNIDEKYKNRCYECIKKINNNDHYKKVFNNVYKKLYCGDFKEIKELWSIKNIDELFISNTDPFCTNLIVLLGFETHKNNIEKIKLDNNQISIHKKRVKECFENDLENRGYKGIRVSQMLWSIYFIRTRIIEVGRLQYEYTINDDNKATIKIHIPRGSKLDILSVKKSISDSKEQLKKMFNISNYDYVCNSWLLSNQIYEIIDKDTNISKFHELFNVQDGENCINDILNFVYELGECDNYSLLPENTILQKKVKEQLLNKKTFYLGLGILK